LAYAPSVRSILENFIDTLYNAVNVHRFEDILIKKEFIKSSDVGSLPEAWTKNT
jgi:hypothetical protein